MKHELKIIFILMMLFFVSQILGLYLLNYSIKSIEKNETGKIEVKFNDVPTGRPEINKESYKPLTYVFFMIILGTIILLLIIKMKLFKIWKSWFFLAIMLSLFITLSVFIPTYIALIISIILTILKLYKPNIIIHNITEVFIYSAITIILAPIFTLQMAFLLLIFISIYDAIAVWKVKHMITMAKAQAEQKMFAGLLIPYTFNLKKSFKNNSYNSKDNILKEKAKEKDNKIETNIKIEIPKGINAEKTKTAILGGGDIAFPMLFSGSVMIWLIENSYSQIMSYFLSLIVVLFSGIGLFYLFLKSEKDKFYPAMPFISAGCFLGFIVLYVLLKIF